LKYPFFGLPEGYKIQVFEELFNLAYYGGGGFPVDVLYDLPVLQRKFYVNLVVKAKEREAEAIKANKDTTNTVSPPNPNRYENLKTKIPKK